LDWRRFEGGEVVEEEDCDQREVSKEGREGGAGDGGGLGWEEFGSAGAAGSSRISALVDRRLNAAVWRFCMVCLGISSLFSAAENASLVE
jgi:hypothetical protein